ncbi:hypothetical protein ACWEO1_34060 [Kitasatospora cineracea]
MRAVLDRRGAPHLYHPPTGTHRCQNGRRSAASTVSALLDQEHVLAATRFGENADTAPEVAVTAAARGC